MEAAAFDEANITMDTPKDTSVDKVYPVRAWKGKYPDETPVVITRWRPTVAEVKALVEGGSVWLHILGEGMPPVSLTTDSPFERSGT